MIGRKGAAFGTGTEGGDYTDESSILFSPAKTDEEKEYDEEVQEALRKLNELNLQYDDMRIAAVESVNMAGIFLSFLTETGRYFLEHAWHYFAFPVAAVASVWRAANAWKETKLKEGDRGVLAKAGLEIVSAVIITIAVIGGLCTQAFATAAAPVLFIIALAAKSLFHLGKTCMHAYKAYQAEKDAKIWETFLKQPAQQGKDHTHTLELIEKCKQVAAYERAQAKANAIGFFAGLFTTIAVGFVFIAAKPGVAVLGVISAVVGTVTAVKQYKNAQGEKRMLENHWINEGVLPSSDKSHELSENAKLLRRLSNAGEKRPRDMSFSDNDELQGNSPVVSVLDAKDAEKVAARAVTSAVGEANPDVVASDAANDAPEQTDGQSTGFGFRMGGSCAVM